MLQNALFVLVVVVLAAAVIAVPAGLTVVTFLTTRALVGGQRRARAGLALAATLVVVAYGLASTFGGLSSFSDTRCLSQYRGGRNLEGASVEQSTGSWPPGLRCRYAFGDGEVSTYRGGVEGVWVATAMTAVFGAAMGVIVVGRHFSKKGDMLF